MQSAGYTGNTVLKGGELMKTKEAIEFLEGYLHPCGIMEDDDYKRKCQIKLEKILDEVLPHCEALEAENVELKVYKHMWESIESAKINDKTIQKAIRILIKGIKEGYQNKS